MKGKNNEFKGKWSGSKKEERKEATRQKVREAFAGKVEVEIIPAIYDTEPDTPKILRVAAYCRVSTDQESQTESYELQVQHYESYIQSRPDWAYVKTYADEGRSGTNVVRRVHFQEMIADCEAGLIDLIITKDIRRFARNTLDCISYVRKLKALDPPVGVYFEDEHLNTLDRGNDAILALLSSVAEGESENKSEAMKWSYKRRFANGIALCPTWALLGYTTDDYGNMVIVPEEAEIVKYIYDSFIEGWGVREIAEKLTAAHIPTVKGLEVWPTGSVYNILRNEKYCGDVVNQKTFTPDFRSHRSVKNRGQERKYIIRDHHPAIVSREIWNQVQELLSSHRGRRKVKPKEKEIVRTNFHFVKRGHFKGFVVYDPAWTRRDIEKVMHRLGVPKPIIISIEEKE